MIRFELDNMNSEIVFYDQQIVEYFQNSANLSTIQYFIYRTWFLSQQRIQLLKEGISKYFQKNTSLIQQEVMDWLFIQDQLRSLDFWIRQNKD
jgi:hypothetical protein